MLNNTLVPAFIRHFFIAKRNGHGVHSPFVYALARKVFPRQKHDPQHPAEQWRKICLQDQSTIEVTDFGTGKNGPRRINHIARHAAKRPAQGAMLKRLVEQFNPQYILELGTSLGITTLYQARAGQKQFISMEGCPAIAAHARKGFGKFQVPVEVVTGNFDHTLADTLQRFSQLDYVYLDGNHRYEPTMRYFTQCLEKIHEGSVIVLDDIHWSMEMEAAWNQICNHPRVTVSIDLFHFGLVFFKTDQPKEHFMLFS